VPDAPILGTLSHLVKEPVMRTIVGFVAGALVVLGSASSAQAQAPYSFNSEPLMSINRSYLGYGNMVYNGPGSLSPYYSSPARAVAPVAPAAPTATYYVPTQAQTYYAPARPRFRLFGWRRGYAY
jgi:hypothetical protein